MGVRKQKNLIEKATEVADQVLPQVEAVFDQAVERAQEGIHQAAPLVAQGKAAAAPLVAQGKEAASGALAHALDVAAHAAESTQHFAEEHAAALKEEPAKKKGGKFRTFLIFSGLAAVVGVIAKKLSDGREAAKWQSATSPTPPAPARSADDAAGADPAEALSDASETPHAVTTPDNPADEVEVPAGPQEVAAQSAEAREDLEDIAAEEEADNGQGNDGRA